jgi:O-antigen/teichoic acid export membrane protein
MAPVLTLLCVGSALSYISSFLGYGMTALRRYKIQVPILLGVVIITILSCYWLSRYYGLIGTACGMLVGNLALLLMSAAVVWRTTRVGSKHSATGSCAVIETAESAS